RRPTVRRSPSFAIPAKSAVATSGITTIDSKLRNSVPTGLIADANAASCGWPAWFSQYAAMPRTIPAIKPIPIHRWLLIGGLLYRHARQRTRAGEDAQVGLDSRVVERIRCGGGAGALTRAGR